MMKKRMEKHDDNAKNEKKEHGFAKLGKKES